MTLEDFDWQEVEKTQDLVFLHNPTWVGFPVALGRFDYNRDIWVNDSWFPIDPQPTHLAKLLYK